MPLVRTDCPRVEDCLVLLSDNEAHPERHYWPRNQVKSGVEQRAESPKQGACPMTFTGEVTPNLGNTKQVKLHDSAAALIY